jgi:phosphoribosylformylglycinamidine synthase
VTVRPQTTAYRPPVRPLIGPQPQSEGDIEVKARVTVYPRPQILDPQGKAIRDALERAGFEAVEEVRAGKSFDIQLATGDQAAARGMLEAMSEKLLANPLVEDYEITLE